MNVPIIKFESLANFRALLTIRQLLAEHGNTFQVTNLDLATLGLNQLPTLEVLRGTPLFGNTAFTPDEAERYIREDRMDGVAIGRPLIYDPDYVGKLQAGEPMYQDQRGDEFWW